jgi:hypothetical protein
MQQKRTAPTSIVAILPFTSVVPFSTVFFSSAPSLVSRFSPTLSVGPAQFLLPKPHDEIGKRKKKKRMWRRFEW